MFSPLCEASSYGLSALSDALVTIFCRRWLQAVLFCARQGVLFCETVRPPSRVSCSSVSSTVSADAQLHVSQVFCGPFIGTRDKGPHWKLRGCLQDTPTTTLRPCITTNKQTNKAKPSNNSKMVPSVWTVFTWFSVCVVTVNFFFTVFLTSNRADTFCLGCWCFYGGVALRDAFSAFLLMFLGRSQECLNVVNKLWFWLAEWGWGLKLLGFRVSVHCNPINTRTMNTLTYHLCLCPYQIEPFLVRIFRHEHKVFQTLFAPCCQQ